MKLNRIGFFRELKHGDKFGNSLKKAVHNIPLENEEKIILESGTTGGIIEVTITEKNSNVTKTFNVIVKEPATGLTVTPTEANVMKGNTIKLTVTLEPSNATDKVIWSSSDESIATVSEDGTVTGIAIGTATITARCGNFSQECNVVVEKKKVMLGDLDGGRIIYV